MKDGRPENIDLSKYRRRRYKYFKLRICILANINIFANIKSEFPNRTVKGKVGIFLKWRKLQQFLDICKWLDSPVIAQQFLGQYNCTAIFFYSIVSGKAYEKHIFRGHVRNLWPLLKKKKDIHFGRRLRTRGLLPSPFADMSG